MGHRITTTEVGSYQFHFETLPTLVGALVLFAALSLSLFGQLHSRKIIRTSLNIAGNGVWGVGGGERLCVGKGGGGGGEV